MADIITVTVGPDAEDYADIHAAIADVARDLVSADEIARFLVSADIYTTQVVIDRDVWVTDATRYILIEAASGARAGLVWVGDGSIATLELAAPGDGILTTASAGAGDPIDLRIDGMQIGSTATGANTSAIQASNLSSDSVIEGCWVRMSASGSNIRAVLDTFAGECRNTILYGNGRRTILADSSGPGRYRNVTGFSIDSADVTLPAFDVDSGAPEAHNCVVWFEAVESGTREAFDASFGGDNNAAPDTTSPGANSLDDITDPFEDSASFDATLADGSALIDEGSDQTANGVTEDIVGTARPQGAEYDIGAHEAAGGPTVALTGTVSDNATEAEIVAGGETAILTLTDDTWVASGATFNAERQAIIDGFDSAQAEAAGWNAEVRDKEGVTAVVRTSDTVVTVTFSAAGAYSITASETITVTVPASALVTSADPIVANITFTVTRGFTQPDTPTITVDSFDNNSAELSSSAFADDDGDGHDASQWQVTTAADTGYAATVFDSGEDQSNLTSISATGLTGETDYICRVRHKDDSGDGSTEWSEYSDDGEFTTSADPVGEGGRPLINGGFVNRGLINAGLIS
jgi:hypothetical protein